MVKPFDPAHPAGGVHTARDARDINRLVGRFVAAIALLAAVALVPTTSAFVGGALEYFGLPECPVQTALPCRRHAVGVWLAFFAAVGLPIVVVEYIVFACAARVYFDDHAAWEHGRLAVRWGLAATLPAAAVLAAAATAVIAWVWVSVLFLVPFAHGAYGQGAFCYVRSFRGDRRRALAVHLPATRTDPLRGRTDDVGSSRAVCLPAWTSMRQISEVA
ncbi:hypothetical protein [Glaciihabitans tibetensis]|uniref:hypothetical protein n=1 Tax=Glaciihabitans tibetensis TaxID=1266600 RepID=UPI0015E63C18|nr:hypothetical protein [Glaciihabitans tibetensis]